MQALVIGGSGFIGPAVVRILTESNHLVTVLNRGTRDAPFGARQLIADRSDHAAFTRRLLDRRWDLTVDLTAYRQEDLEPFSDLEPGHLGRYVFCSTGAVYAPTGSFPYHEDAARGRHPSWGDYGANKTACEDALENSDLDWTVIRPTYVYGPGNHLARESFLWERITRGRPILIPENGESVVQFIHVDDLARLMVTAALAPAASHQAFNAVGPEYVTFERFAQACAYAAGLDVVPLKVDLRGTDATWREVFPFAPISMILDGTKATAILNQVPAYSLEEGLRQTYPTWRSQGEPDTTVEDRVLAALEPAAGRTGT